MFTNDSLKLHQFYTHYFQPQIFETEDCEWDSCNFHTIIMLLSFFVFFCKINYHWFVKTVYFLYRLNFRILKWFFRGRKRNCDKPQRINEVSEKSPNGETLNQEIQQQDDIAQDRVVIDEQKEERKRKFNILRNSVAKKLHKIYSIENLPSAITEKADGHSTYLESDIKESLCYESNAHKLLHSNLLSGVNARIELLDARKKLFTLVKKNKDLENALRDVKENVNHDCINFKKEVNNTSLVHSKHAIILERSSKSSIKDSNYWKNEIPNKEEELKRHLVNLNVSLNQLMESYSKEIAAYKNKVSIKDNTISKLETSNKKLYELCEQVLKEKECLKYESIMGSI